MIRNLLSPTAHHYCVIVAELGYYNTCTLCIITKYNITQTITQAHQQYGAIY